MPSISSRLKAILAQLPAIDIPGSTVGLHEFTLFNKLSTELRNRIWTLAAFEPRYIKLIELDRQSPSFNQTWDSRVPGQTKHPGIIGACRESKAVASKHYKRCYEKAQLAAGKKPISWSEIPKVELKQAKKVAMSTNGKYLYVNFACDIFLVEKFPATEHLHTSEHIYDYNFKHFQLQWVQRVQQVYKEDVGMSFPLLLFWFAGIRIYRLELDSRSKELISGLSELEAGIHMRQFRVSVMSALLHFLDKMPLRVAITNWEVEMV
ncbi:hypothetical protein BKA64DRAFT_649336 [Cadophora sp. MPI-SDFR-AT-0126]|nr:hypothetical protein BKA64DRAFT_649336 [Leotiomycetes sp. MPI-SDFR-AT-0126]